MNKKGFTLIEIIGAFIVIGLIATVAVPGVSKYIQKGKLTTFFTYEDSMEEAATNAVLHCIGSNSRNCEVPEKGNVTDIKLDNLIQGGFIDEMKSSDGASCDMQKSFVRVENRGNLNYKFTVCLYCDEYTSDNDICK